jgi:hypothetical protein
MAPLFLFSLRIFHLLVCANYLKYHKGTNGPLTKPTFFYHNYSNSLLYYNQCICNSKNVCFSFLCSRCLCTCHVSLSGKFLIKVCAPAGNETVKLPSPPAPVRQFARSPPMSLRKLSEKVAVLDAFPKVEEDNKHRSGQGGLLTVILACFLGLLTLSELIE